MHPPLTLGAVRLNVADAEGAQAFYERAIGLHEIGRSGDVVRLGTEVGTPLVELVARPEAPRRPPATTGLFHLAILVPTRLELARAERRLAQAGWPLSGASDHLVSEAIYLRDPEGNGIEIYRDRPREDWLEVDGQLQMATLPLDLDGVRSELAGTDTTTDGMHSETRLGHVHLQVSDLVAAESFYHGLLGFDVTVRSYPGALFLASGGYHHHVGLNTWAGEGLPAPPPGALGLGWFEVVLGDADELGRVEERLGAAGIEAHRHDEGLHVADPPGNGVLLRAG